MSTDALQINDTLSGAVMGGLSAAGNVLAEYAQERSVAKENQSWQDYAGKLEVLVKQQGQELDRRKTVMEQLERLLERERQGHSSSSTYLNYLMRRFVLLQNAFNRQSANVAAQLEIRTILENEVQRLSDPTKGPAIDHEAAEQAMRAAWDRFMTTSSVVSDPFDKPTKKLIEEARDGQGIQVPVVEAMVTPAAKLKM